MATDGTQLLKNALKQLLFSGDYSDFTIVCGERTWKVHKAIICPRSDYFARAVTFGKEAEDKCIDLVEDDPEVVGLMLEYFYTGDYKVLIREPNAAGFPHTCPQFAAYSANSYSGSVNMTQRINNRYNTNLVFICPHHTCNQDQTYPVQAYRCPICADIHPEHLIQHARLYELADKYQIQGLKPLIEGRFKAACQLYWKSEQFPIASDIVYATTPEEDKGLRKIVVDTIAQHMELLKKPEMEPLMVTYNGLAFGLLKIKAEAYGWQ
ncbi:hypothetical protein EJ04DRAFT_129332 [Polyplosphaeria fusca]|uniref:BTB domain-containing protein n=1 Tax=Polyplosphaeria fusca TaxID=682080 RepID=A0A9P4R5K8_9PLEO|nr:hypothetical protein EJ04DRAFT_129332 [Polyplosphaeria fusca]